ncbi:MAG: hypothetical protein LBJ94_02875 [Puniceicoccales bacterium]|jgi:hypothetical protein|nr:hypothetical protein [Puniceicoccales bacterium]
MNTISKAIQRRDRAGSQNPATAAIAGDVDRRTISGCYGIDSLFAKKSRRLSFTEFCDGLKDIFLAIPIFAGKLISATFGVIKRPICTFGIMCIAVMAIFTHIFTGKPAPTPLAISVPIAKNSVVVQETPVASARKSRIISGAEGHTAADMAREKAEKKANLKKIATLEPSSEVARAKAVHAFEDKLREFFAEHAISDVVSRNGYCRLKLQDGIFTEHSTLCNHPKIVLESSTDDEIIFSDGAGIFCALAIESLLP